MDFPCTSCGACCRQLPAASVLNRGDGLCRHHDEITQRCTVYAQRPLICRVDDFYREKLAASMPRRVYYLLQAQACVRLDARNASLPDTVVQQLAEHGDAQERATARLPLSQDEATQDMARILAVASTMMAQAPAL